MTHVHVGSLRYDSFTKVYNVDWNIPDYISRTIENDLKARGTYTFIPIVAVFQPSPATLAAYGWAPCSKSSLPDFLWKSDLQFLGPAVISRSDPTSSTWVQKPPGPLSRTRVCCSEGKTQAGSKAQQPRQVVSISRGLQRRHRGSDGVMKPLLET